MPLGVSSGLRSGSSRNLLRNILGVGGGSTLNQPLRLSSGNGGMKMFLEIRSFARFLVHELEPSGFVGSRIEFFQYAHPGRDSLEYLEIVPAFARWLNRLFHVDDVRVPGNHDVVALKRSRAGKHYVGMLRQAIPAPFVNDYGFGLPPGAQQLVDILVMVEGVATGPVNQSNVRVLVGFSVEVEPLARPQKHVADPGDGNEAFHGIAALRERFGGHDRVVLPDGVHRAVAEADAAPRQAEAVPASPRRLWRPSRAARRGPACSATTTRKSWFARRPFDAQDS